MLMLTRYHENNSGHIYAPAGKIWIEKLCLILFKPGVKQILNEIKDLNYSRLM